MTYYSLNQEQLLTLLKSLFLWLFSYNTTCKTNGSVTVIVIVIYFKVPDDPIKLVTKP
jgi:hypothetical protein